jgi:hypothetical protein
MKKVVVLLALVVGVAVVWLAHAAPVIVSGSPQTVTGSYGSPATGTGLVAVAFFPNPTLQQWSIQHGTLNNTNDISIGIWINTTSNFVNAVQIGTWHPANTNATTELIYPYSFTVTNYTFPIISTTNAQSFFIQYGQ